MPPQLVKTEVQASRELVPHGQNKSPMRRTFKTAATMLALGLWWDMVKFHNVKYIHNRLKAAIYPNRYPPDRLTQISFLFGLSH